MKRAFKSLREEIHAIVCEAHRAGRPISSGLIWGLLTRDVSLRRVTSELTWLQRGKQVIGHDATPGLFGDGRVQNCYEPGPSPLSPARGSHREIDEFLGAMEMLRLQAARAKARAWVREGKRAA